MAQGAPPPLLHAWGCQGILPARWPQSCAGENASKPGPWHTCSAAGEERHLVRTGQGCGLQKAGHRQGRGWAQAQERRDFPGGGL